MNRLLVLLIYFSVTISCSPDNQFYIDSVKGDDSNSGHTPRKAWKSIQRANQQQFKPGDNLYFSGTEELSGTLQLDSADSGTEGEPLTITSLNAKSTINGGDSCAIISYRCTNLIIQNISCKGSGRKNGNRQSGIMVDGGKNITIDSVSVYGFRENGIYILDAENVKLTRIHAFDNGMAGISTGRVYQNPRKFLCRNIYIGDCVTENNPGNPVMLNNHSGSGIIVAGADSVTIEYCLSTNNGWDMPWEGNGPVGIWAYQANRVTIQHCVSHHNRSNPKGWDGGGFDFDGGVTHSVMQYNLSYNNVGPGIGLFQYWGADPWSDNIVRYNISYDDGIENDSTGILLWSGKNDYSDVKNAQVYNNLIINNFGRAVTYRHGDFPGLVFQNNIFVTKQEAIIGENQMSAYQNNLIYRFDNEPSTHPVNGNIYTETGIIPLLLHPEKITHPRMLPVSKFYQLTQSLTWLNKGHFIENNGGEDFSGAKLPTTPGEPTNIGLYQNIN